MVTFMEPPLGRSPIHARDRGWLPGHLSNEICQSRSIAVARWRMPGLCAERLMPGEIERGIESGTARTGRTTSPAREDWPFVPGRRLVFLLDAASSIETRLLEHWIDSHRPEGISPASCERIAIPSSRQGGGAAD